jgi:S-adenosylmethionine:tRNA ribosyltransferase-isomerase
VQTSDFDFPLPEELIAQVPSEKREGSRLLALHRSTAAIDHRKFIELPGFLAAGDVLVLNDSRVIPARLHGVNARTKGQFELLLLEENAINDWWVMLRPGKRGRIGTEIEVRGTEGEPTGVTAKVIEVNGEGHRQVKFTGTENILGLLPTIGQVPLPPYIHREKPQRSDWERYQTVFAKAEGSVAAPTAGLHFTEDILQQLRERGVRVCFVTLHVGLGTFAPVKVDKLEHHQMHVERYEVSEETARTINQAKQAGRRVFAVGTTTLRVLESVAVEQGRNVAIVSGRGKTAIFIYPPHGFRIVDALLTNFHLPCSTLLMLVSAFAAPNETRGRELILNTYREAIEKHYRFFSYGDAMLIL